MRTQLATFLVAMNCRKILGINNFVILKLVNILEIIELEGKRRSADVSKIYKVTSSIWIEHRNIFKIISIRSIEEL